MSETYACSCAVCRASLATPVEEIFREATFVPLMIPCEHRNPPSSVRPPSQDGPAPGLPPVAAADQPHNLAEAIHLASAAELGPVETPSPEALLKAVSVTLVNPQTPKARDLLDRLGEHLQEEARNLTEELARQGLDEAVAKIPASAVSKAPTGAVALQRLAGQLRQKFGLFKPDTPPIDQPRAASSLCPFDEVGLLFLERMRQRPMGQTVERAPFYELSVEPGETISISHDSFAQRELSQEEIFNQEETFESSLTSELKTSLSSEYSSELKKVTDWKISASAEASIPIKAISLKASTSGSYGATTTSSSSNKEAASRSQSVTQTSSSKLFRSHKTTVKVTRTDSDTTKNARTFTNKTDQVKKIYMRKMVRVHHMSYERYGVRLAWSPCIEDPGRDVRDLIPGMAAFPKEIKSIREKWNAAQPPAEVGSPPSNQTVASSWSGQISGGVFGKSMDQDVSVAIPSGYVYADAYIEKTNIQKNPGVAIKTAPAAGATGAVTVVVHLGLSGGLKPDKVDYRVVVIAAPGPILMAQWNTKVQEWRDKKAGEEIDAFLATKKDEIKNLDLNAWPLSELMRRAITQYFGDPNDYHSCDIVEMLHRVFEWESFSYQLFSPWWNPNVPIDGLQALATTFLNASWAKLYIPMRPGYEQDAISFLASVGAIPQQQPLLGDIQYYLDDMRQNVEPLFKRVYTPAASDAPEIDGPCDILLTTLGEDVWEHTYESQLNFQVLDRWIITTPTDGVDYEEAYVRCPLPQGTETPVVKLTTSPAGLNVQVDGKDVQTPVSFEWIPGSTHTIAAAATQTPSPGARAVWQKWSDGGVISHTVTAPASSITHTAVFKMQYELKTGTVPPFTGGLSVTVTPPGDSGFYDGGTSVALNAVSESGSPMIFSTWQGDVSGSGSQTHLVMDSAKSATAVFERLPQIGLSINSRGPLPNDGYRHTSVLKSDAAYADVRIDAVVWTVDSGTGSIVSTSVLPIDLGAMSAGVDSASFTLTATIPATVTRWVAKVSGVAKTSAGFVMPWQLSVLVIR